MKLDSLVDRMAALRRFVALTADHLPADALAPSRALLDRAGERLALSRDHTVVALAGATGSGKSSLFNALAGAELSAVGVRRPTTGEATACVWGESSAKDLLDWLQVGPRHHHDAAELPGLVLLDLPDFDSVRVEHRLEADRLVGLVDLIVWVLDPQKYADKVVHQRYLAEFHRHRDVTVVALNQADLLSPADRRRCLDDLARLVAADGLGGVPVLATSTVGEPGLSELKPVLAKAVAARLAALRRLAADVDDAVADLAPTVAADPPGERVGARELTAALAAAAGVPLVVRAVERAYVHRGIRATGWPPTRWLRRLRPDPLDRLHLGDTAHSGATSVPAAAPAARAAVGLALREVADRTSAGLPPPWPAAVLAAARSRDGDLTDALDLAIRRTDLAAARRPWWWRGVGLLQWVTTLAALVGLGWLGARFALFALGLPTLLPEPRVGRVPWPTLLLAGGLLAGLLMSLLVRPVLAVAARRRAARARSRLQRAVQAVADELVVSPVTMAVRAYAQARNELRRAR